MITAPASQETPQRFCHHHLQTETYLRCKRCNRLICAQCRTDVEVGALCHDCRTVIKVYHPMDEAGQVNPYHVSQDIPFFTYRLALLIGFVWLLAGVETMLYDFSNIWMIGVAWGPGLARGDWWRFITPIFLHSGIEHLMFNGIALLALGPEIEGLYGRWRFLVIYLLAGLYGNLLSFGLNGLAEFSLGASGAVFGIVGMYLAFFTVYRRSISEYATKKRHQMFIVFGLTFVYGAVVGNINHAAHVGGLIAGCVLGYVLAPRYWITDQQADGTLPDRAALARRWWAVALALVLFVSGALLVQRYLLLGG